MAVLIAALILVVALDGATAATASDRSVDAALGRVQAFRRSAQFHDAAVLAREHLSVLRSTRNVSPFRVTDTERLVATLERAVSYDDRAQRELAEADRLAMELRRRLERNDPAGALAAATRQLELREKLLGPRHPETLTSIDDLAASLALAGRAIEAESMYRAVLDRRRDVLGDDHPDVATTRTGLAGLCRARGAIDEADSLHRLALAARLAAFGPEHPDVAQSLHRVAMIEMHRGRLEAAEAPLTEALAQQRKLLGDRHRETIETLVDLGALRLAQGRPPAAGKLLKQALALQRAVVGAACAES
jgi:tetratricopeptide (TPR) repeat protein